MSKILYLDIYVLIFAGTLIIFMYRFVFLIFLFIHGIVATAQASIEIVKSEALKSSISNAKVIDNESVFVYYIDQKDKLKKFEFVILDKKTLQTIAKVNFKQNPQTKGILSQAFEKMLISNDNIYVFSKSRKNELFVSVYSLKGSLTKEPKSLTVAAYNAHIEPRNDFNNFYVRADNRYAVNVDFAENEYFFDKDFNIVRSKLNGSRKYVWDEEFARYTDDGKIYILNRRYTSFMVGQLYSYPIKDNCLYFLTIMDEELNQYSKEIQIPIAKVHPVEKISFNVKGNKMTFKALFHQEVEGTKKEEVGLFHMVCDLDNNKMISYKEQIIDNELLESFVPKEQRARRMYFNFVDLIDMPDNTQKLVLTQANTHGIYGSYMSGQEHNNLICLRLKEETEYTKDHFLAKDQVFDERFLEIEPANKYKEYDMLSGVFSFTVGNNVWHLYNDRESNVNITDASAIKKVKLRRPKRYGLTLAIVNKGEIQKQYIQSNKEVGYVVRFDSFRDFGNFRENKLLNAVSIKGNKCYLLLIKPKK